MKANELMIGDFVYSPFHCERVRVTGMMEHSNLCYVKSLKGTEFFSKEANANDFEPILLTTKILEQNGICKGRTFVQHSLNDHTNTGKRFVPYTLLLGGGRVVVTVTFDEDEHRELETYTPAAHVKMKDCQYVHELQHALRLCGIEKELKMEDRLCGRVN